MKDTLEKINRLKQYLTAKIEFTKSADSHVNDMLELSTTSTLAFFNAMFWEELNEIEESNKKSTKHIV